MRAGDAVSEEDPGVEVRSGRGVELRPVLPADHGVFCARRHMVGQQFDLLELEDAISGMYGEIEHRFGCLPESHTLTVSGLCPNCRAAAD